MSRASQSDNSTTVSLFPFLAVLLCTMGSLLLILVVMVKVAREKAIAAAAAEEQSRKQSAEAFDPQQAKRTLQLVSARKDLLDRRRTEAESLLHEEQLRLSHIEDHMRRLQDQLVALQLAAAELDAMEQEHHDDQLTAKREVARLQKLIDETRQEIEDLKNETGGAKSYSIIPYEGPNGTRREPIYIECRRNEVILQPEGIRLTRQDFEPPLGAGNPLASALRTAREYMVRRKPEIGQSANTEPYPLVIVRPDGVMMYYRARQAIESWDADFGYELVDEDMNLQFPAANPELANLEMRAIEQARARQRMLAAAAPRAYAMSGVGGGDYSDGSDGFGGSEGFGGSDGFGDGLGGAFSGEFGPLDGSTSNFGGAPGPEGAASEQLASTPGTNGSPTPEASVWSPDTGSGRAGQSSAVDTARMSMAGPRFASTDAADQGVDSSMNSTASSNPHDSWERLGTLPPRGPRPSSQAAGGSQSTTGTATSVAAGTTNPLATSGMSQQGSAASGPSANFAVPSSTADASTAGTGRERFGPPRPGDVAVRRTIQVVVRRDRLSILPDRDESPENGVTLTGGKEIPIEGETEFAIDGFVSALREHVRNWGIAGTGLYWRPVLNLNVAPDGNLRADEISSLLRNSGIDVQRAQTARRTDQTDAQSTR